MIFKKTIDWNLNICLARTPLHPAFQVFYVDCPSILRATGHIGLKHRQNYGGYGVGWGLKLGVRGPFATEAEANPSVSVGGSEPTYIRGAQVSGNIEPAALHYAQAPIAACETLDEPGWYRVELWANCHGSSAGPALSPTSSVVEVHISGGVNPENTIIYEITPGCLA